MKYCLKSYVDEIYLAQADQIRVRPGDDVFEFLKKFPKSEILMASPSAPPMVDEETKKRIIIETLNPEPCEGFKTIYKRPVQNYADLRYLEEIGMYGAMVGAPLFFDQKGLENINLSLRVEANGSEDYFGRPLKTTSPWMRPEDQEEYTGIDVIEFYSTKKEREEALFRIYKNDKTWGGKLGELFNDFEVANAYNQLVDPSIKRRANCRQRCMEGNGCALCDVALRLAMEKGNLR